LFYADYASFVNRIINMHVLPHCPTDVENSTAMSLDVRFGLRHVVREHRKRLSLTQDELAERAGTTGETISRIERGAVEASPETLRALAPVFGVPPGELLALLDHAVLHFAGHGPQTASEVEKLDLDTYAGYKPVDIPLITEAQAGEGRIVYEDAASIEAYAERRVSRPEGVTDKNAFAVMVKGDSMVPVFRPGRYVVVSPNIPVAPGDEVFVALTTGERLIKIAYRADGGYVLESANPTYSPRFVKAEDIQVMYPVVWAKRKEG